MKLFEIYEEAINENNVWNRLSELLSQNNPIDEELSSKLSRLLEQAKKLVFDKFDINPIQRLYFISGSARLYLYPDLIAELNRRDPNNFPTDVGDLDIVIPNRLVNGEKITLWEKAGVYNKEGIYKPMGENNDTIEVFDTWKPQIACPKCKFSADQDKIMSRIQFVDGYWFMNLVDVLDYKQILSRDKEMALAKLIEDIEEKHGSEIPRENRLEYLQKIAAIITNTTELEKIKKK